MTQSKRKEAAPLSEGGTASPKKRSGAALTWDQLTPTEIKIYNARPDAFKSKKRYLKSVQDSRSA